METTFTERAELLEHYRRVRERLSSGKMKAMVVQAVVETAPPTPIVVFEAPKVPPPRPHDFGVKILREGLPLSAANARRMARCIAAEHGISEDDIFGADRHAKFVAARNELYVALFRVFNWSYANIGKFCGKDHTTVLHGVRKLSGQLDGKYPRAA